MPRKYQQNLGVPVRGQWDEENVQRSVDHIKAQEISIQDAATHYCIPESMLHRGKASDNKTKFSWPQAVFGRDNEKCVVTL